MTPASPAGRRTRGTSRADGATGATAPSATRTGAHRKPKTALPFELWTERDLAQAVVQLARLGHWRCYHTYDSRRSTHGYPDYTLLKGPRLIFAELKSEKGRVRPEQVGWLDDLSDVPGVECYLWRPSDFDEIVETLTDRKPVTKAA